MGEKDIGDAIAGIDDGYLRRLGQQEYERIQDASKRAAATTALEVAIQSSGEARIADCWQRLQSLGGDPGAEHRRKQCENAVLRATGVKSLKETLIDRNTSVAKQRADVEDLQIIRIWESHDLKNSQDATPQRPRIDLAYRRGERYRQFEEAIQNSDDFAIAELGNES